MTFTSRLLTLTFFVVDLSSRSQLMESESADEGICTGTQIANDESNTNAPAPNNQNAIPLNDVAPSLEQETLMGVCFFALYIFSRLLLTIIFFNYLVIS